MAGYYVQKTILELRKTPLYDMLDRIVGKDPVENKRSIGIVTTTDLRVFARYVKLNIFMYEARGGKNPKWGCYTGTKKCDKRAAIYLKMVKKGGGDHVRLVFCVTPKEKPLVVLD